MDAALKIPKRLWLIAAALSLIVILPDPLISLLKNGAPAFTLESPGWVKVDELHAAARIREVMDGDFFPTDTQLQEHKNDPGLREMFPVWIGGILARLSGSVAFPFVFFDFVMPFVTAFLIYFLLYRLTGVRWLSLAGTLIVFFYFDNNALSSGLFSIRFDRPLIEMERFPSPQIYFPILIGWLILIFDLEAGRPRLFLTALLQGTMFYCYIYYAVPMNLAMGCFAIYALAKKRWDFFRGLLIIEAIALVLAIPYFWMLYQASRAVPIADILERFGLFHDHFIFKKWSLQYFIIAATTFFLLPVKRFKDYAPLIFLLIGLVLLNKQFFLGSNLHPMHWHSRILHPFSILATLNLLGAWRKSWIKILVIAFAALLTVSACVRQIRYGLAIQNTSEDFADERALYDWMKTDSIEHKVFLTLDPALSKRLLILTSNDVFLPHFTGTLASQEELEKRFLFALRLLGFDETKLRDFVMNDSEFFPTLIRFVFGNYYTFELHRERQSQFQHNPAALDEIKHSYKIYIPESTLARWAAELKNADSTPYRLDYVVVNPEWKKLAGPAGLGQAKKIYGNFKYEVYDFTSSTK